MTISCLLIANRGEIACRIIRTCRRLGIDTVLAASEADMHSLAARQADQVICIGPPPSPRSYLDVDAVVRAARTTRADAVHPGYGFLSENQALAAALESAGIIFVGPGIDTLQAVGDKLTARRHARDAHLPVVPGAAVTSAEEAARVAEDIGYPLLIKAVSGGGGRGMKRVDKAEELSAALDLAMSEADAAFGDARVYLERYVAAGRHIEVQVLGDGANVIHLGDRDCSIQRRYQKLVEEAPAPEPDIDPEEHLYMEDAAVRFARHLNYRGAGTVEFLVDRHTEEFYFLEMNARIQVEHPVTELRTGIDLVEEQIHIAEGRPLRYAQNDIRFHGHAIECRINAEDPDKDFQPSPGKITRAAFPAGQGIRVDTHIETGSEVPPYYDSLLAKLICHAAGREEAIALMISALQRLHIEGVRTNTSLHLALMRNEEFASGAVTTTFLPEFLQRRGEQP